MRDEGGGWKRKRGKRLKSLSNFINYRKERGGRKGGGRKKGREKKRAETVR